jgi:hypothetical protein
MARSRGDGKRVVQDTEQNSTFTHPTNAGWQTLETALGCPLSLHARMQISGISVIFSVIGSDDKNSTPVREVIQELTSWRRRTKILSGRIWSRENTDRPAKLTREWIEKTYFNLPQVKRIDPRYHLLFLAHALDAALAACDWVTQELSDPGYEGVRAGEEWPIWAALIIHILQDHGISTTASSAIDKQTKDSKFVSFMMELQKYLPEEFRRFKSSNSLVKGIQGARKLIKGDMSSILDMYLLLGFQGLRGVNTPAGIEFKRTAKFSEARRKLIAMNRIRIFEEVLQRANLESKWREIIKNIPA